MEFAEKCLDQLKSEHRDAIDIVFIKGHKCREYRFTFGLTEWAAKRRVERAIIAFEKLFTVKVA